MNNVTSLLGNCEFFLESIFKELNNDGIDLSLYELDHICYRVSTNEKYSILKNELLKFGVLLAENIISGRYIATFKLNNPIVYNDRKIYIIEIPSPKDGSFYQDGFEHIEFVINSSFEEFINKYHYIDFITKDLNKISNPDIKIKYPIGSVKFHQDSLENVILNEK